MDKVNTDTEQASVMAETAALKVQNDMESRNIDALFAERQQLEASARQIETDTAGAKQATELVISTMDPATLDKYQRLRAENEAIETWAKSEALSHEVAGSELRQESWRLRQQLGEVTARRDDWRLKDQETPEQERERLLQQVKADNQEIASMQKSAGEVEEKVALLQEKLHRMEGELEEGMEERSHKYTELCSKEQMITEFLNDFDQNKAAEEEKIQQLEANIVTTLSHISQGMTQSQQLPEPDQFQELQADLAFKQEEKEKSEATAISLDSENQKLQQDLVKVEELEGKVTRELQSLGEEIDKMTQI
ncbi:Intraflagellar transport protein 74 homolog [Geodia barretti]|uniref:Intraflagellar transport protein 74 homolog n=1 Tax=Geodia barretti TaxID=519541 RepID=A0AA35R445_GEOBA|nr:Intraflagellar transport protein 74 homolog [Geodia barretti]